MARVLVVDDSSIMRRNLSAILTKAGHTIVSEATNGEQAFKEYERTKPDLVTMDITMPVLDGIGAVKKIMQADPHANIIMISALDQKFMVLTAIQNGAKHYIIKPFSADKVLSVINEVLKSTAVKNPKPQEKQPQTGTMDLSGAISDINESVRDINNALEQLRDTPDKPGNPHKNDAEP